MTTAVTAEASQTDAGAKKLILGFGNPLLDISNNVDKAFFEKWDIKPATAALADEKQQEGLYTELAKMDGTEFIAGGSTLNTIRIAGWMLQGSQDTSYMGCIGDDDYGKALTECAKKDNLQPNFMVQDKVPTGTCAVAINQKERALVANLAAANEFKASHIAKGTKGAEILTRASNTVVYSSGFFLTVSPETMIQAGQACLENGGYFGINLSAEFIIQFFGEKLGQVAEYADLIFGNETEALKYAEVNKVEDKTPAGVCKALQALPSKNTSRPRTVVITQGCDPTLVCQGGEVMSFDVPKVDGSLIVDTNGAGDSFVGGFLSQLVLGKSIKECVSAGNYAAGQIIQTSGCAPKGTPSWTPPSE